MAGHPATLYTRGKSRARPQLAGARRFIWHAALAQRREYYHKTDAPWLCEIQAGKGRSQIHAVDTCDTKGRCMRYQADFLMPEGRATLMVAPSCWELRGA